MLQGLVLQFLVNDQMKSEKEVHPPGQLYQHVSPTKSELRWSQPSHRITVSGLQDFSVLSKLKNVILSLRKDWNSGGIRVQGRQDYEKRLLLAESEIEGLLKRKIDYSVKDSNGQRVLDYTNLLNEKENQIIELEKKIQNLEQKLRRASAREVDLEGHVVKLTEEMKRKEELIALKHNSALAEVAASSAYREALNKVKKNIQSNRYKLGEVQRLVMQGVVIPDVGSLDIRGEVFSESTLTSRSRVYQHQSQASKYRIRLVQFFREFERLVNQSQGITDFQVQRILQGFLSNMTDSKLYQKVQYSIEKYRLLQDYRRLTQNFATAAAIFADLVAQLRRDNANYRLPKQVDNIFELLQRQKVEAFQYPNGAINIEIGGASKVVEVPVQDARTKHLIHLLATELKRLFLRFPKLQSEIDPKLAEFVQQEVIDIIEVDEIEKLVQIVKYIPQIVKVENIYTHSTEKQRKIEFHLRVLIKALLEELQKVKEKTGAVLSIDEGVIGMIKAEIMDVVNVDDILKVFRVTPKIVEVEKLVEKVVERVIEVPKVVTVEKIVQKIVEVQKIKQVEKIVHVPVQKPLIVQTQRQKLVPYQKKVQTIVQVPTIVEKIVELEKVVPKVMEVEVMREKIVEVEVPVQVDRVVNHIQTEVERVQVIVEKIVPVEKVVQKIIEVPVFVEKIVEKVVEVPQVIQVEKVVEKIVPVVEYRSAREVENHIETKYQIVDRIIEKIVPIVQTKEKIKEVVKEIQVIKQVNNVITEIKQVEVIRQKLVVQQVIKEVEKVQTKLIEVIKEVPRQIEKYIEIPIIKEIPVIKELIVQKPVISRIESVHIKEVVVNVPTFVKQPQVLEIEKFINVYIEVPKTIKYIEEKIIEVPTIVDRIKEVPVEVEKIIEKMVEVPKVVEVQKIVEKVVVVPRVIEKVVEVPQLVEKVIEKQVIRQKIVQVEKIVQMPVIQEVIKEVETIKNIYIEIQKPFQTIVEKPVEVPRYEEKVISKQVVKEVPITVIQEVPVEIEVEKVVPLAYECVKAIEVERQVIVPFEIPVPVETVIEKVVPKEEIRERIIPTPQIIEKIVPVVEQVVELREIQKYVEKILIEKEIKQVEKIIPYIQEVIKEVPTIIQKVVTIQKNVDNIVTVQRIIEKVIQKTITLPQIYEVERIKQKLVQVPKLIEIEKVVPQIIKVNQYIHKIAEKIIEVPTIIESIKEVVREQQKIVPIKSQTTEIVEVQKCVQKLVYAEKLKEVVRNVNYIEKVLQIIDRIQQVPVAVTTTEQKFIQVPFILEKIVEKIVLMPQIVEVLKYVHEVCESEDVGVAVDVQVGAHEARYRELSRNLEIHLDQVLKQLRYLKSDQATRSRIEVIERFLEELRKFILTPRIVKVVEERIVQSKVPVDKLVKIPAQDEDSLKMELSMSLLIQKLIGQLKRLRQKTGVNLELDEDIKLIFFSELGSNVPLQGDMLRKLQSYTSHVQRQFESLGHWTQDHQLMLNSFLQQRFLMAELIQDTSSEMEQIKAMANQQMREVVKYKQEATAYAGFLRQVGSIINQNRPFTQIIAIMDQFEKQTSSEARSQPVIYPGKLQIDDERIQSLLRQKDAQISHLKDSIYNIQQSKITQTTAQQQGVIRILKSQLDTVRKENSVLLSKTSQSGLIESYKSQIHGLQERNLELQTEISTLKSENYNLQTQKSLMLQNVSFRRDPESSIQEAAASRQAGFDRSKVSQYSQGLGRSGYQQQTYQTSQLQLKPGQETASKKPSGYQGYESRLSQSGARVSQTGLQSAVQQGQYGQSGTFAQRSGIYSESLQQRKVGQGSSQQYQPYKPYQSGARYEGSQLQQGVQPAQGTQSGIRNFGVEDSHTLRSQQQSRMGLTQSGVFQAQQRGTTVSQSQIQGRQEAYRYYPGQSGLSSQGYQLQEGSLSRGMEASGISRGQSRGIPPYGGPQQREAGQQSSRTYTTGLMYGSQVAGKQGQQPGSILSTPIEGYKFTSPSPSGAKLTQSIIKGEESLSKFEAESPQGKQQQTPRGRSRYYSRPQQKQ